MCGVRASVRPGSSSSRSRRGLVVKGVCLRLACRPVVSGCMSPVRGPLYSGLSRPRPFPRDAPRLPPLLSILQRCFMSTAGAAILYVSFLPSQRRGHTLNHTGPPWSACIVNPIENSKAFLTALTRLLVMIGSPLHRSHAHQTTLCTLHATADCTYSVSFRLE